jgi:hypothetical protein
MARQWTFEAAREMLGEVRRHTERAVTAVDALEARRRDAGPEARAALDAEVRGHVSRWMRAMEALGVEVPAPWRVEFEGAEGAFCWAWPEERLTFRPRGAREATPIQ